MVDCNCHSTAETVLRVTELKVSDEVGWRPRSMGIYRYLGGHAVSRGANS